MQVLEGEAARPGDSFCSGLPGDQQPLLQAAEARSCTEREQDGAVRLGKGGRQRITGAIETENTNTENKQNWQQQKQQLQLTVRSGAASAVAPKPAQRHVEVRNDLEGERRPNLCVTSALYLCHS